MGKLDYKLSQNRISQELGTLGYSVSKKDGKNVVSINGINVEIFPHDNVFSVMNRYIAAKEEEIKKDNNSRLANEVERCEQKLAEYNEEYSKCKVIKETARKKFLEFLRICDVSSLSELKKYDKSKYDIGRSLESDKYKASSMYRRALNDVCSESTNVLIACCNKIKYSI